MHCLTPPFLAKEKFQSHHGRQDWEGVTAEIRKTRQTLTRMLIVSLIRRNWRGPGPDLFCITSYLLLWNIINLQLSLRFNLLVCQYVLYCSGKDVFGFRNLRLQTAFQVEASLRWKIGWDVMRFLNLRLFCDYELHNIREIRVYFTSLRTQTTQFMLTYQEVTA